MNIHFPDDFPFIRLVAALASEGLRLVWNDTERRYEAQPTVITYGKEQAPSTQGRRVSGKLQARVRDEPGQGTAKDSGCGASSTPQN